MAEAETEKPIPERAAAVTDCSSITYGIAKDETVCTVAVGMLDSAKGGVFESPIDIQSTFKETGVQFVKIVHEELENEEYLASNGNNNEAKDENVIAYDKDAARDISDVNVMAIDKGRAADESTSQITKADAHVILDASEAQTNEREHDLQDKTDIENLAQVDEAKHIKEDDEYGIFNAESDNDIDRVPDASKEPPEIINNEGSEPAAGDSLDSSPGAVTEMTEEQKLERGDAMQEEIAEMEVYNDEQTNIITEKRSTQEPLKTSDKEDIEPTKDEPEKGKTESSLDTVPVENKGKSLEIVDEEQHIQDKDKHVEIDERTNDIDLPVAILSEKENTRDNPESIAKEDTEPAKEDTEPVNLQSSLNDNKNEAAKDEPDPDEPREEKLERVNYDEKVKIETKTKNSDDERSQDFDSISDAEPSDRENRQVTPEVMGKEHESSLVAVPEEPKASMMPHNGPESSKLNEEHEKVTMNEKEVNGEETYTADEKKYEPAEKAEFELLPVCQDKMNESMETMTQEETVPANETNEKKEDEEIGASPVEQQSILETTGGEMHETTTRDKIIDQTAREIEPENLDKVFEESFEYQRCKKPAKVAADDGASLENEIGTSYSSEVVMEGNAGNKQSSEKADDDESTKIYTPAANELTADNDIEGNENAANSASKDEQTNEEPLVISACMVWRDDKELADVNELIQENDNNHEVHVDSVISSVESSSETGTTLPGEKESLEEKLKRDNTLMCENIVINEHNDFAEIVDKKNHVEKKESLIKMDDVMVALEDTTNSPPDTSYNPKDKNEEVRDDDNQDDKFGEKHEEASNSSFEGQACEGNNRKENTEISTVDGGTSKDHEVASELVPESFSQETMTEIEDTQIEQSTLDENMDKKISDLSEGTEAAKDERELNTDSSNSDVLKETIQEEGGKLEDTVESVYKELDQNSSNTRSSTDDFQNDHEAAYNGNISSNEIDVVEGSTYDGEIHEDVKYSSIKEVSQSINKDIYLIKQEGYTDFESTSQSVSQEHCHDTTADSEATKNDIGTFQEFNSMGNPVDSVSTSTEHKEYDGAATDPEEAIQQTSTAANENEGNGTGLIAEKDVDEKIEEKGGMEGEVREGLRFHGEQMATEKLDNNNESEHGESSEAVEGSAVDETIETVIEREKWKENNIEELSEQVSGKTMATEEGTYIQDSENTSNKHEERFAKMGEYKHDVAIMKPEETSSSAHEEPTQETITTNIKVEVDGQRKEFSQNLEPVQNSRPEDNIKEITSQNDSSKIENSADDCNLKHMIIEEVTPNVEKENTQNNANVDEDFDECPRKHASVEETVQGEVGQENGEGSSCTGKGQSHHVTSAEDKIEVNVSDEEKEAQRFKIIPESQPEDECPKCEPDAIKNVNLTDDDTSKLMADTMGIDLRDTIPDVVELNENVESTNENNEANLNTEKVHSPDGHTMSVPILPEQIGKYEYASKTECGEEIYQAIDDKQNTVVTFHEQKADLEEPENLTELVRKGDNQGDASKPISIDNSVPPDSLDKVIHHIVSHNDDPETAEVENENVLEDSGDVSDIPDLVAEATYDGVADKHEDSHYIINIENKKEVTVQGDDTLYILEEGHEAHNQDANGETECVSTKKALHLDEGAKVLAISTDNDCYAPTRTNSMEMVVGQGYGLESNDKPETTNIFDVIEEEVPSKEGTAANILKKTLNDVHINFTKVASGGQIEGDVSANVNTNSELTGCEEKQKFDEVMPEVSDRDQHNERYDNDDNVTEENPQSSMEIGTIETSEEWNQVMNVDAYDCQYSKETVECKEASLDKNMCAASEVVLETKVISMPDDDSIELSVISKKEQKEEEQDVRTSSLKDELEDKPQEKENEIQIEQKSDESSNASENNENESFKAKGNTDNDTEKEKLKDLNPEKSPNVVLCDLEKTIGAEDACEIETKKQSTENNEEDNIPNDGYTSLLESSTGLEQGNQSNKSSSIAEGSSHSKEVQEADDVESNGNETTTICDHSLPDIAASNEETGQVENAHMEVGDSPYLEQIGSISLGEDVILDMLTEVNTTDHLENDYTLMIGKEDRKELSGKGVCENDKISEEDRTNDEQASRSSLIAQEVEGGKLKKIDEVVSEERREPLELEKDEGEEIPKDKEVYNTCLGESSKNDFIKPIVAEADSLPHTMPDTAENATNDADEKDKDAELVTQICIEAMGDNLHDNKDSLGKSIHDTSETVPEENVISMPEDHRKKENTEEQDAQTSLWREDLENKPQEIEYKIQIEQKTNEAGNGGENNGGESLKERDNTENDSNKEKLEDLVTEKSPNVVLNDLETTRRNEDAHESETKDQCTYNQNEDFVKDKDIKLVVLAIELSPGNQSDKSTHTDEESSPTEEGIVEHVAKVDGSLLQNESVEPESHEKSEQNDSTATQNEEMADLSEPLNIGLHDDKKEIMQHEEGLTTSLGSQEIAHSIENIEKTLMSEEDAAGSSHEQIQEDDLRAKENIDIGTNSIPNDEVTESEGVELNDKQTTTTSDDSTPDIAASNEETGQVENANEKVGDSSNTEKIESVCLSEGVNTDMLIKPETIEHLERGYVSMIGKQVHEELNGKEVCENVTTSEEDEPNNGQESESCFMAQEVEGGEPKADDLVSKEKQEMLELENNKGSEILKKEEVSNACLGVSLMSGFNKHIANEVDRLPHEEKAEVTNDTNENVDDAELVIQTDKEIMDDNLHVNDASLNKCMHNASEVVPERKCASMPEDNNIEVIYTSDNENKEERDVQISLQIEEPEEELREKENGIHTVQEPGGSSDASQKNVNDSFKEKGALENKSEKEKLEGLEPERSLDVELEDLEAAIGNEDIHESETNKECPKNKNEKNLLNDGEMKLVDSEIESEPSHQSDKSTHTIKGSSQGEETLNIEVLVEDAAKVDANNNEGNNCNLVGDMHVTHDLVEESKYIGPPLQKESVEPETQEKSRQSDSIDAQNEEILDISEQLNIESNKDAKQPMKLEECSTTLIGSQEINNDIENNQRNILSEEDAVGSSQERIQKDDIRAKENIETSNDSVPSDEAKDAELVTQMDIETMDGDLNVNEASLYKCMHNSFGVVPEENVQGMPEDNKIEVGATSNNENKEAKDFQTIIQREELEDELQKKENEIQMEQKSDESSNESQNIINESFIEKDATENDNEKERLEVSDPEKCPNVFLVDLKAMIGNEDTTESETNKECTKNKNEKNFLMDREMTFADSMIESETSNQSEMSNHTEGSSEGVESLNIEGLVVDVANINAQTSVENYSKIVGDFSVTHDFVEENIKTVVAHLRYESVELETHDKAEQIVSTAAENESVTSNVELQNDTRELVPVEEFTTISLGIQEITDGIEKIERNAASEEDAVGSSHEQIQEDDTQTMKYIETDTDHVPHDKVKEYNHRPSNEGVTMMNNSENLETTSTMASVAEETIQEPCENFSKISDYWPKEYKGGASTGSEIDKEHPSKMKSYADQHDEDENFTSTSADSAAVQEKILKGEDGYVTEASILDAAHAEESDELNEASDFVPKEEVAQKISSSIELTEDNENLNEESAMQELQVNQLEVTTEKEQLTGNASHEVEVDNLQEESQQTGMGELPVSQFLMKYILQEEGDMHKEVSAEKCEDETDMHNDRNENDVDLIHEEVCVPQSDVQIAENPSIPEEVGSDKSHGSSESAQPEESAGAKENLDIIVVKDDLCPESTFDTSKSRPDETEKRNDQVTILSSEISTHATGDIMELISTNQSTSGVTTENEEHCRESDLAQDEKIQATVIEETIREKGIQKDNGISVKDVDDSIFGKASEEDISQKEAVIEIKECLQDVENVEAPYTESERRSATDEDQHGEISEIKSEATKVECVEAKKDVGNQVQVLKNDLTDKLILPESEKGPQFNLVVGSDIHALKIEDKNPLTNIDEKQTVETIQVKMDEDKKAKEMYEKEEKEEYNPEESGCSATTVETKDSELKSIQKCDQCSESVKSSSSSTADDNELGPTSELQSEVKGVENGEKKQDVFNQDQAEKKIGSGEQLELPKLQGVKNFDVVNETIIQPPQMAEKTVEDRSFDDSTDTNQTMRADTNVGEDKTDDEKEEEDKNNPDESGRSETVHEEGKDAEPKRTPKKSHGILSGVGSKVKHSIAKVKKAITGKSSHSKAQSAK